MLQPPHGLSRGPCWEWLGQGTLPRALVPPPAEGWHLGVTLHRAASRSWGKPCNLPAFKTKPKWLFLPQMTTTFLDPRPRSQVRAG